MRDIIADMINRKKIIFVGVVLIFCVGFLVYATKKPFILPTEDKMVEVVSGVDLATSTSDTTSGVSVNKQDIPKKEVINTKVETKVVAPVPAEPAPTKQGISIDQVALHGSRTSCWSAINGSVYDLTSWIPNHPGGEGTILSICGIDGSDRYNGEHGSKSKPARILFGFKIGEFSN